MNSAFLAGVTDGMEKTAAPFGMVQGMRSAMGDSAEHMNAIRRRNPRGWSASRALAKRDMRYWAKLNDKNLQVERPFS